MKDSTKALSLGMHQRRMPLRDALTLSDREQSIRLLANAVGLPEKVIATALDHRPPTIIKPLGQPTIAAQQYTANLFYENRLVPVKVDISQRVWRPQRQ